MSDYQAIKYRLIGAAVIVGSFIFAWWLLLDHEVHRLGDSQMDIPEPMKIERFDIEEPTKPDLKPAPDIKSDDSEKTDISTNTAEEEKPADLPVAPAEKPQKKMSALDSQDLPEAWVLQVASFQDKSNAQQLQKKLVAKELPAYVKVFNLPEGKSYRVLVGPKLNKERAASMARQIEKDHGLKSMIMRYKPGFEE